jgi:predicted anti-sigma-YlaC factor YlaD
MKHKQYESWILDEAPLTDKQQQELDAHLKTCESCRVLRRSWVSSKQLITQSAAQFPAPGFTDRWQMTVLKKCRIEKVRRYRLTLFVSILLTFASSVIYMLVSGSFLQMFANGFTMISEIVMGVTNGLSTISYWLSSYLWFFS